MYDANTICKERYACIEDKEDNFNKIRMVHTSLLYEKNVPESPIISLIIPTYKRGYSFEKSLQSAVSQKTDFLFEILVVDNTPLDENGYTPALRIIYKLKPFRVRYFHNEINIGSGYNWNRGVELSKGQWVCFLHDDDVLCSDALTNIKKIIDIFSGLKKPLGYVQARMIRFTNNFQERKISYRWLPFALELTRTSTLLLGHTHTGMPTCGTAILRKAYLESGGINYDYGPTADAVLGYRIMKKYTVIYSPVILGGYHWGENESVRLRVVRKLIYTDFLLSKYCFSKVQIWKRLCRTLRWFQYVSNYEQKMHSICRDVKAFTFSERIIFLIYLWCIKFFFVSRSLIVHPCINVQIFYLMIRYYGSTKMKKIVCPIKKIYSSIKNRTKENSF